LLQERVAIDWHKYVKANADNIEFVLKVVKKLALTVEVMRSWGSIVGIAKVQGPELEVNHSSPFSVDVKNDRSYTSSSPV
jgi:hypothetical protein